MHCLHTPNPPMSRVAPAASSRWLGRSIVACVLAAASLALAACGSSRSPTVINTATIEHAIEQSSLAQRGLHAEVSCPSRVEQKQGLVFACMPVVGRRDTRFLVTELDGLGNVHYVAR
jgi:hypothetical protein